MKNTQVECYCDYEPPKVSLVVARTARKGHKCSECDGQIAVGERYEQVDAIWSDWEHLKICCRCCALRQYTVVHIPCLCWSYGAMIDDCMAAAQEWNYEAPGLLFGAYRRLIAIKRNKAQVLRVAA